MRHPLLLALLCYFVLGGGYWLVTPALEAPREEDHLARASACALNSEWRDPYTNGLGIALAALGHADLIPTALSAKGPGALRVQHGQDEVTGSAAQRTLGFLRVLSLLLGLVSLVCTYRIACCVFPGSGVAAVAVATMASMPQWACSHAVLWHGPFVAATTHGTILVLVRASAQPGFRWHDGLAAGLLAGLGLAAAPSAWFVVAAGVLAHAFALRAHARGRATCASLAVFLAVAAFAWSTAAGGSAGPTVPSAERGVLDVARSFVGEFGRQALPLPLAPLLATVAVLAGAAFGWTRKTHHPAAPAPTALTVVAASCSLGTIAGIQAAVRSDGHGRELLAALGPMMVLTAAGLVAAWRWWVPARWQRLAQHPLCFLVPFAPSLLVLLLQVAPAARIAPSADPAFRTLHVGLRSGAPPGDAIATEEQAAEGAAPPTLRWNHLAAVAPAAARFSVLGWRNDHSLLFAPFEIDGHALASPQWRVPDAVFARLRPQETFTWRARILPGHSAASPALHTVARRFTRAP